MNKTFNRLEQLEKEMYELEDKVVKHKGFLTPIDVHLIFMKWKDLKDTYDEILLNKEDNG